MSQKGFVNIVLIVVVVAIIIAGGYFIMSKRQTPTNQGQEPPALNQVSDWKTYTNEKYGFEISYPPSAEFYDGEQDRQNIAALPHNIFYPCDPRDVVACLYFSPKSYTDTNFEGAAVAISMIKRFDTEAKCVGTVIPKKQIDNVTFSETAGGTFKSSGHESKDWMYRALREQGCLEIILRINTTDLAYSTNTKVSRVNEGSVLALLNSVLSTFKFLH